MTFKKISLNLTLFTLLLALLTFGLTITVSYLQQVSVWPFLLLFMYGINLSALYFLFKSNKGRSVKFVNVFMLTSFGKMMLYVAVMLVYVYLKPALAVPFVIVFLLYFMFFLVFEVVLLLKMNKNQF